MEFIDAIKIVADKFKERDKTPVRIIGHLDCDGICATSILIKTLKREDIKFVSSVARQLDEELLNELKRENYKTIFFVDLGSGYLNNIEKILKGKEIFILDHHKPEESKAKVIHLNPHLFKMDGNLEISGSGVVYLFSKFLNEKNKELAYLAMIGAIGDMQENNGFVGLNDMILKDAVESKKVEVKRGLRMFGMQTKPLFKILQYSTDPYIPNVTGDELGAKRFLSEIGIDIRKNGKYKKLIHLDNEDMKKLVTAIILKRLGSEEKPDDVLGNIYLLTEEEDGSSTKDAREFSTLLNACGRLHKPSFGIGTCLGNKKLKESANDLLMEYKREIIDALNWFYKNRNTNHVLEGKGYVIINADDRIRDTLIGTLSSIISKSNLYKEGTIIIGMASTLGEEMKISVRVAGFRYINIDLRNVIKKIIDKVGGIAGGHVSAAGGLIMQKDEEKFIKSAEEVLSKVAIEEVVK